MARYMFIETRDPFESTDVARTRALAQALVTEGHQVTLFLVQNGVLAARPAVQGDALAAAARAGVTVLADEFSLRQRGIDRGRLADGVAPASIDVVVDHMAEGGRTLWQ